MIPKDYVIIIDRCHIQSSSEKIPLAADEKNSKMHHKTLCGKRGLSLNWRSPSNSSHQSSGIPIEEEAKR